MTSNPHDRHVPRLVSRCGRLCADSVASVPKLADLPNDRSAKTGGAEGEGTISSGHGRRGVRRAGRRGRGRRRRRRCRRRCRRGAWGKEREGQRVPKEGTDISYMGLSRCIGCWGKSRPVWLDTQMNLPSGSTLSTLALPAQWKRLWQPIARFLGQLVVFFLGEKKAALLTLESCCCGYPLLRYVPHPSSIFPVLLTGGVKPRGSDRGGSGKGSHGPTRDSLKSP